MSKFSVCTCETPPPHYSISKRWRPVLRCWIVDNLFQLERGLTAATTLWNKDVCQTSHYLSGSPSPSLRLFYIRALRLFLRKQNLRERRKVTGIPNAAHYQKLPIIAADRLANKKPWNIINELIDRFPTGPHVVWIGSLGFDDSCYQRIGLICHGGRVGEVVTRTPQVIYRTARVQLSAVACAYSKGSLYLNGSRLLRKNSSPITFWLNRDYSA